MRAINFTVQMKIESSYLKNIVMEVDVLAEESSRFGQAVTTTILSIDFVVAISTKVIVCHFNAYSTLTALHQIS